MIPHLLPQQVVDSGEIRTVMCQYLVLNAEQKHIYMKILHRKDAYKSESMQLDYFQKNLFLYPTITEKQCDKVRYTDTKQEVTCQTFHPPS